MEIQRPHSSGKSPKAIQHNSKEPRLLEGQTQPSTLREWLPRFLSGLHTRWLKSKGFRKKGHTFSRDMESYWERFNFQGSAQNYSLTTSWRFYVNVGVEFKDLPKRTYWSLFPNTHWAKRIDQVIGDANYHWEYNLQTDQDLFAQSFVDLIDRASAAVASEIEEIRRQCI